MPVWLIVSYCILSALCIFSIVRLCQVKKKTYAKSALSVYIFYTAVFLAIWILKIAVLLLVFADSVLTFLRLFLCREFHNVVHNLSLIHICSAAPLTADGVFRGTGHTLRHRIPSLLPLKLDVYKRQTPASASTCPTTRQRTC